MGESSPNPNMLLQTEVYRELLELRIFEWIERVCKSRCPPLMNGQFQKVREAEAFKLRRIHHIEDFETEQVGCSDVL